MPSMRPIAALRQTAWRELLAYAIAWLGLAALQAPLHQAALLLPLCLIAAKDLAHLPDARRRLDQLDKRVRRWRSVIAALLPPELVGMLKLDRQMWLGAWRRLRRRPPPAAPSGTPLTYLQRGGYGAASALVLLSVLLELPLDAAIASLFVTEPHKLALLHAVSVVTVLYTLVWVAGDRWHLGAGQHSIDGMLLHLRVGARTCGAVPLAAIEAIEAVDQPLAAWRRARGVASRDTLLITPFDQPNCVIVLQPDAEVAITHWQVQRRLPRYVLLYLDRPALLMACARRE